MDHMNKSADAVVITISQLLEAENPVDGLRALARWRTLVEDLVTSYVARARSYGASWAEIGEALGVTPQAVQKRYPDHG